jgi:hypothetical protein
MSGPEFVLRDRTTFEEGLVYINAQHILRGDDELQLVVSSPHNRTIHLRRNLVRDNFNLTFDAPEPWFKANFSPSGVVFADIDQDGYEDLTVVGGYSGIEVVFEAMMGVNQGGGSGFNSSLISDCNAIFVFRGAPGAAATAISPANLTFARVLRLNHTGCISSCEWSDFDGDGVIDLIITLYPTGQVFHFPGHSLPTGPHVLLDLADATLMPDQMQEGDHPVGLEIEDLDGACVRVLCAG